MNPEKRIGNIVWVTSVQGYGFTINPSKALLVWKTLNDGKDWHLEKYVAGGAEKLGVWYKRWTSPTEDNVITINYISWGFPLYRELAVGPESRLSDPQRSSWTFRK